MRSSAAPKRPGEAPRRKVTSLDGYDSKDEEHEDIVRWIGGVFDPKGFDLNRINRDWKGAKRSRR